MPPPLPDESLTPKAKQPLGKAFFILFFGPIVSMAVAAGASALGTTNSELDGFGVGVSILTLPGMLLCSIICAVIAGRCWGAGMGFLAFLGIQVVYIAIAIGGCSVTSSGFSVH